MKKIWTGCFVSCICGLFANHVNIEGDAFYVGRSLAPQNIIMQQSGVCSCEQVNSMTVAEQMGHEVAFIGKFSVTPSPKETLQFRFTDWINFKGIYYLSNSSGIDFPFESDINTYDWDDAQSARGYYNSDFISFDVSYFYFFSPRWYNYFFFGIGGAISYAKMDEQFKVRYYNNYRTSKYDIKSENALYGGQLMMDVGSSPMTYFSWGIALRGGIYGNMMQVHQYLDDNNGTIPIMNSAQNSLKPAYYGELNPYIIWKPFPAVNLIVGYMLMYFNDIALAPAQINYDPSSSQGIDNDDSQTFQGFYGGLNFYF